MKPSSERWLIFFRRHLPWMVFWTCIGLCVAGVVIAVRVTKCDADAGRGGAIADAIALAVMLLDPSYASKVYAAINGLRSKTQPPEGPVTHNTVQATVQSEIELLLELLNSDAKAQRRQNWYLAGATFFGTLFWGFGDLIARHFIGKCP